MIKAWMRPSSGWQTGAWLGLALIACGGDKREPLPDDTGPGTTADTDTDLPTSPTETGQDTGGTGGTGGTTDPDYVVDWTKRRITARLDHTCALDATGRATCWGEDTTGETAPPAGQYYEIDVQDTHGCGLLGDQTVRCWGDDTYTQSSVEPLTFWKSVSVGLRHSCGISLKDEAVCWGSANNGVLAVPPTTFTKVVAADLHNCGIVPDGRMVCWGVSTASDPGPLNSSTWTDLDCSLAHCCAVQSGDGTVACWGDPTFYRTAAPPDPGFVAVATGGLHSCGLKEDGSVVCWGSNDRGQATPPKGAVFKQIALGYNHSCGLAEDHSVTCWGDSSFGQFPP
jgi:hypothetical protein